MIPQLPPSVASLERLAADIQRNAAELEGEMRWAIEAFIRRYSAPEKPQRERESP